MSKEATVAWIEALYQHFSLGTGENNKPPVRRASVRSEIRTENLLNKSPER
jgi:hypothetical protein